MTFDEFIRTLGIREDRLYTYREIGAMLNLRTQTIETWSRNGRRTIKYGHVSLERFHRGRCVSILGKSLIDFLRKTQDEF